MTPAAFRALLADHPERAALLFDFDGTLAPIVADPAAAHAAPGVVELLDALATRVGRVAVISGRPLSFLVEHLPVHVDLSGLYGIETRIDGVVAEHGDAARWRAVIAATIVSAGAALPGAVVEPKGVSMTVHFRQTPELEADVVAWAASAAANTGLHMRSAKASVELHPPIPVDKGTSVRAFAAGFDTVVFAGDDVGDLPAFAALDELAHVGVRTAKLAAGGTELPAEVAAAADLVVDGPAAVVALFAALT